MKKVLLVEDDKNLRFVIEDGLRHAGYQVQTANHGEEGWVLFQQHDFDICLLDVMMPAMDGFSLARQIRAQDNHTPILFITAKSMLEDKIEAFQLGGDDYITKPFAMDELMLRMEVFLRRTGLAIEPKEEYFDLGVFRFYPRSLCLEGPQQKRTLTQREADLLLFFCDHANQVLKREKILKAIWGDDDYFIGRSLDVFISKLRKYLQEDPSIRIVNYHGIGFKLEKPTP